MGLTFIPIYLVQRATENHESALILGSIRSSLIIGTLFSGVFIEWFGSRRSALVAFILSAIGLGAFTQIDAVPLLILFGSLAQFGDNLSKIALRFLINETVERHLHKEVISWVRAMNNFGQTFSFMAASFITATGVRSFLIADAVFSGVAFLLGLRLLPRNPPLKDRPSTQKFTGHRLVPLFVFAFVISIYSFIYEFCVTGVGARIEFLYPNEGVKMLSWGMFLNTILCTILAIPAGRHFTTPSKVIPVSFLIAIVGLGIALGFPHSVLAVLTGFLLMTFSEVMYGALALFVLIRLVPNRKHSSSYYSFAVVLSVLGKILAGALTFPWLVRKTIAPEFIFAVIASVFLACLFTFLYRKEIDEAVSN
jgi:hypothetical protein